MATREAAAANRSAAARRTAAPPPERRRRLPLVLAAVVAACAAIAIGVSVSSGSDDRGAIEDRVADARVSGAPLDAYVAGAQDFAIGKPFPELTGSGLDGQPIRISGADGPAIVVYLAHWCQHCQAEVPVIVDWLADGGVEGVAVRAVSTSFARERGNWPPSAWLEREGWEVPTLLDPGNEASVAVGQGAFPFFVAVGGDGTVVARQEGRLGAEQLTALAQQAAAA